nr:MAG: capsid protein [clictolig virus 4]
MATWQPTPPPWMAKAGRPRASKRIGGQRVYMDPATSKARYGPTMAIAKLKAQLGEADQLKNRLADEYYGKGRYGRRLRTYGQRIRRSRFRGDGLYTGTGGFWSDMWSKSQGLRNKLGAGFKAAAGAMGGQQYADMLTKAEGAGRALGMGTYTVNNDIVDDGSGQEIPTFGGGPNVVTVSHKEYITDIFGPENAGTFQNTPYSINPGLERTFPWLSQVAANYEEYTLKQCIFTFRSTVTDFVATNGQVGSIIMATQYNPTDAPFTSKQDAMEYDMAMSGKVSGNMLHGVECDPAQLSGSPGKYVRAGPVRSDDDLKQYDHANLNVCISNIPQQFANQALGELWVSYTVELRKPKFFVSRGLNILRDAFVGQPEPGVQNALLADLRYGYGQQNRIGGRLEPVNPTLSIGSAMKYTFPAGFSGSVVVKAYASAAGITSDSTLRWALIGNNIPFPGTQTPPVNGSMQLIKDIFADGGWEGAIESSTGTSGGPTVYASSMIEVHLSVSSPSTAAAVPPAAPSDNIILFWYETVPGVVVSQETLSEFQLDIAIYNTAFNYTSSGNLIVMNSVTDLQEEWP